MFFRSSVADQQHRCVYRLSAARIIAHLALVSEAGDTSFHYLFRLAEERTAADKPGDCEGDYFIIVLPLFMCESAGCSSFCAALSLGPS